MKKISSHFIKVVISFFILLLFSQINTYSYMCKYKEDYYRLFHTHYAHNPDDYMENIYWLERAVKASFANPLYANAKIENEIQWEKYRYLFQMHLNLKLVEQHLRLGAVYDKKVAYFYDAPWKDEYLRNLENTKACYNTCYYYWKEAKAYAEKANIGKFKFLYISELQGWEDERERIFTGELDYEKTLDRELKRVEKVISDLVAMKSKNY